MFTFKKKPKPVVQDPTAALLAITNQMLSTAK